MNRKEFLFTLMGVFSVLLVSGITVVFSNKASGVEDEYSLESCTPYNVFVSKGSSEYSAQIEWSTLGKCNGFVLYGVSESELNRVSLDLSKNKRNHYVKIETLSPNQIYFYVINSNERNYGGNGQSLKLDISNL